MVGRREEFWRGGKRYLYHSRGTRRGQAASLDHSPLLPLIHSLCPSFDSYRGQSTTSLTEGTIPRPYQALLVAEKHSWHLPPGKVLLLRLSSRMMRVFSSHKSALSCLIDILTASPALNRSSCRIISLRGGLIHHIAAIFFLCITCIARMLYALCKLIRGVEPLSE